MKASDIQNKRLMKCEVMSLLKGQVDTKWDECIKQGSDEYMRFKPPFPRWLIGRGVPLPAPSHAPYKEKAL